MKRWWTVTGDLDPLQEGPVQIFAIDAPTAAAEWAEGRGHDPDDVPEVTVVAEGEPVRRFQLKARVTWRPTALPWRMATVEEYWKFDPAKDCSDAVADSIERAMLQRHADSLSNEDQRAILAKAIQPCTRCGTPTGGPLCRNCSPL